MTRRFGKLVLAAAVAGILFHFWLDGASTSRPRSASGPVSAQVRATWGNDASLPDHFARHGSDFGARNPEEYARLAAQFLQRARAEGLPATVDSMGVLRVFDSRSGTFGAYNPDGTTKTFFKTGNAAYFQRQPGRRIDLRAWR